MRQTKSATHGNSIDCFRFESSMEGRLEINLEEKSEACNVFFCKKG